MDRSALIFLMLGMVREDQPGACAFLQFLVGTHRGVERSRERVRLVGSGIPGGRVIGGVDSQGGALTVNLATGAPDPNGTAIIYSNFVAGLLALCGVDAASHIDATELDALLA